MLSITDGESNTTYYEYDGVDRNIRVIYADTNELIYTYDKNSNLLTQKDPNGTITMNTYDSLNRLVERNIQTGTGTI
jgi:YD repeat-containing protein